MAANPLVILLVEDESDLREVIEAALADAGCQVVSTTDGDSALAWLSKGQRPALVLLDFIMPRMHGWAFLERLRSDPTLHDVPVVAISILAETHPAVTAALRKPFELASLVETVRRFTRVP
ncbi:response regulator [Archangium violaceum]|uniref:response regulator n=1 Tax=Archangium violaceum TaxID=83451 RepID=UPI00193BD3F0|nr:response regulator [Archangium violaceum]QRK07739.1 response regulator [Archangium violaceum]